MIALGVVQFAELEGPEFQINSRHNRSAGFLPAKTFDYSPMARWPQSLGQSARPAGGDGPAKASAHAAALAHAHWKL